MLQEPTAQQLGTELAKYLGSSLNNLIGCSALVNI
jgi:hypothetical protein